MKIFKSVKNWQSQRKKIQDKSIGFVPTMGALHEGHLSLIKKSKKENDITVVSIFLNPTQFDDKKDLKTYPNTIKQDVEKLQKIKVDYLILPKYEQIYSDDYDYKISENNLSKILCGKSRKGHFDGVLTVVMKLLNIVDAEKAYFGEKDYQQFLLIEKMAKTFFIDTKIIPCELIREKDGLAKSSRNLKLTKEQRKTAPKFYQILKSKKSVAAKKSELKKTGFEIDYIEKYKDRIFGAVKLGKVRLIDNVKIKR